MMLCHISDDEIANFFSSMEMIHKLLHYWPLPVITASLLQLRDFRFHGRDLFACFYNHI